MKAEIFKTIQITGSSTSGSDEAITAAVDKAAETVRNLRWFKVTETRGHIENGKIAHWQVTIDLGIYVRLRRLEPRRMVPTMAATNRRGPNSRRAGRVWKRSTQSS